MKLIKRIFIAVLSIILILTLGLFLFYKFYTPSLSENYGKVDTKLFLGDTEKQPLIVAFGGSQGGNTWTEKYWSKKREILIEKGYAVLSVGYFNTENTPETLDRISINAIYDTIKNVSRHSKIDADRIALLGSSRGGELVLNIASRYKDIDAVVALVPSHMSFSSLTLTENTSAWNFNDQELDYARIPFKAILAAIKGDRKKGFECILEYDKNSIRPVIEVEKINGPILLLSAVNDNLWPSKAMSDKIVNRLKEKQFSFHYENFSFNGGHNDTKKHFDRVIKFLDEHFKVDKTN